MQTSVFYFRKYGLLWLWLLPLPLLLFLLLFGILMFRDFFFRHNKTHTGRHTHIRPNIFQISHNIKWCQLVYSSKMQRTRSINRTLSIWLDKHCQQHKNDTNAFWNEQRLCPVHSRIGPELYAHVQSYSDSIQFHLNGLTLVFTLWTSIYSFYAIYICDDHTTAHWLLSVHAISASTYGWEREIAEGKMSNTKYEFNIRQAFAFT